MVACSAANDDDDDTDEQCEIYKYNKIEMNERVGKSITPSPGCRASQKYGLEVSFPPSPRLHLERWAATVSLAILALSGSDDLSA